MPAERPEVSVVVPVYHEQENIPTVIQRFIESLSKQRRTFELIVINDGSRDRTGELLDELAGNEPRLRIIHLARNYGQTAAMMAGFWTARAPVTVPLDGDGQNEPDEIERLVDKLEEGWDVVSGWRRDRQDSWLRTRVSRVANWLIGHITGVRLHDYGCTLKAYKTSMIRDARLYGEMHRFVPVFTTMHGARITETVVKHNARVAGESKYGYDRVFKVLFDLVLVRMLQRYRTKPMHFFGKITKWSWFGTLACMIFAVVQAILSADPWAAFWGKAPLVGVMFFLLGGFSIMLGLVAELAMRSAYEFNAGRYWDEARRVNFESTGPVWEERRSTTDELRSPEIEEIARY
ncbi:MAG: glycosyltransferase family 2 protein [Planctomycetota bacterium]